MAVYISPEVMEERILMVIRKYNVLYMEQLLKFFDREEKAAGKAVSRLLKDRQIYRNPYTGLLASNEFAYSLKDEGTIQSLWVLIDMMHKREVDGHYMAVKEDFPVRILFFCGQDIYDIIYIGIRDLKLVNGMFAKSRRSEENNIIVLEDKALISQIEVPGIIGFCVVKEGGEVEYYRKRT